jgi:dynactin complex subunit
MCGLFLFNTYICVKFCFLMAEYQDKLLIDLEVRIKQLMLLCDSLKDENIRLKAEIQSKQQEIDSLNIELKQLKTKYDNLKLARTITAASVNVDDARTKLSKLVREVDKCINLLK